MTQIPRSEYPRPQLVREAWQCLNGTWEFEIDAGESGEARGLPTAEHLGGKITVPFCPESRLSGVAHTDFMRCVWYAKDLNIPAAWKGKRILLHFGAVDYLATVWVNGKKVGTHAGGYTPFSFDITDFLNFEHDRVTLSAFDDVRSHNQPAGKQSDRYASYGCSYTRTTGIWQTVWMEAVEDLHIKGLRTTPDTAACAVTTECRFAGDPTGADLSVRVTFGGKEVGTATAKRITGNSVTITVPLSEEHLWDVGVGNLYDVEYILARGGKTVDRVTSYFGLRSVALVGRTFRINGRVVFGRWVLDQGFYPDGIYTAPTDEDLKNDILKSMELGFNGARLHEKVFEPRFLWWADRLGYLCWGEQANWGLDITEAGAIANFLPEWLEAVERDYNHPSVIGWCPFNETWDFRGRQQADSVLAQVYRVTKALDATRPVIDTSGNFHVETDIFDVHDYEQDPAKFVTYYAQIDAGIVNDQCERSANHNRRNRQHYDGKSPVFVSEYGGIRWTTEDGWGYGKGPETEEEFIARYKGLTDALLDNENIMAFCYTQLFDVEQEQNGLMTYGRKFKFDPAVIRAINTRAAAIEKKYNK